MINKPLYTPIKSTKKGKKMMVYVMKDGKKRLIHFGQKGAPDFKNSANYWSRKILWKA